MNHHVFVFDKNPGTRINYSNVIESRISNDVYQKQTTHTKTAPFQGRKSILVSSLEF